MEELRDRLIARDQSALAELYDTYSGLVYGLAYRVTGDRSAAEDVTQDVFISMWERPDSFQPQLGSMRAWLGVLAHRRAVDRVRRDTAARRREERDAQRQVPTAVDLEAEAAIRLTADRVRLALGDLPEEQRQVIDLAYLQGQTYREVAQSLGIPEGTAKSRIRVALRRLAGSLRSEMIDEGAAD